MNDAILNLNMSPKTQIINISFGEPVLPLDMSVGEVVNLGGTRDYRKLINKPSINGEELYDNYDEIDPTVPDWAKEDTKPQYTPDEIGAIDVNSEMSFSTIKELWDAQFKEN